jgi:hypothetical protein
MPCRMAHRMECHCDHEIVMASALPNPIPVDAALWVVFKAVHSMRVAGRCRSRRLCRLVPDGGRWTG